MQRFYQLVPLIGGVKIQKYKEKKGFTQRHKNGAGFTLIELLVVIAILGILAGIGLTTFQTSQMKSRDAKRKSDLEQVQRALEMYYNDKSAYPDQALLVWGSALVDLLHAETIYMKELPKDPTGNPEYCYNSTGTAYQLYAKLENENDPKVLNPARSCGGITDGYNYGVASSNSVP